MSLFCFKDVNNNNFFVKFNKKGKKLCTHYYCKYL